MSCLKEQRANPYILPVDKTSNMIFVYEYIRGMNIPMPQGRSDRISLRQKVFSDVQKLLIKDDVSIWSALRFGRCK